MYSWFEASEPARVLLCCDTACQIKTLSLLCWSLLRCYEPLIMGENKGCSAVSLLEGSLYDRQCYLIRCLQVSSEVFVDRQPICRSLKDLSRQS